MPPEIEQSMVSVDGLTAYLSRPTGGSAGGVLLLPMATGIVAQVREWADELARAGLTALSWDPWGGRPGSDQTPRDVIFTWMAELDDEKSLTEQSTLIDHLVGELGCRKVGTIGWCLGGRFALLLGGRDRRLANVVAYHPTVPLPAAPNHTLDAAEYCAASQVPVMMLYPSADSLVPRESFGRLQTALQARAVGPSIVHLYPDAEHGFSAADTRDHSRVNAEAFAMSWPQVLAFLTATLRPA